MDITLETWQRAVDSQARAFLKLAPEKQVRFFVMASVLSLSPTRLEDASGVGARTWIAMGAAKLPWNAYAVTLPSRWQGENYGQCHQSGLN